MSLDQMISRATFDKVSESNTLERDFQRPSKASQRLDDSSSEQFNDAIKEQAQRAQRSKERENSDRPDAVDKPTQQTDDPQRTDDPVDASDNSQLNQNAEPAPKPEAHTAEPANTAILELQSLLEAAAPLQTEQLVPVDSELKAMSGSTEKSTTAAQVLQQAAVDVALPTQAQDAQVQSQPATASLAPIDAATKVSSSDEAPDAAQLVAITTGTTESSLSQTDATQKAGPVTGAQVAQQAQQQQHHGDSQQADQDGLPHTSNTNTQQTGQQQTSFASAIQSADNGAIQISDMKPQGPSQLQTAPEMNAMDKAVAKQIDRAVVQQLNSNQKVLQIRLTPPELGTVKIEIIEQNGRMTVRLQAEDDSVRHSLERALPQLRNDIRSGNAPIADIQLTDQAFLMDRHRNPQFQQQRRQKQSAETAFSLNGVTKDTGPEVTTQQEQGITIDQKGVHGLI